MRKLTHLHLCDSSKVQSHYVAPYICAAGTMLGPYFGKAVDKEHTEEEMHDWFWEVRVFVTHPYMFCGSIENWKHNNIIISLTEGVKYCCKCIPTAYIHLCYIHIIIMFLFFLVITVVSLKCMGDTYSEHNSK